MRSTLHLIRSFFFAIILLGFITGLKAQTGPPPGPQLNIRNFVIFGGDATRSLSDSINFGVFFTGGSTINSGSVGTYSYVVSAGNTNSNQINADVYSGHHARFLSDFVRGSVTAGTTSHNTDYTITANNTAFGPSSPFGSYGFHPGDLTANGNILADANTTISGTVRVPPGDALVGNGHPFIQGSISFPKLPTMPPSSSWGAPGVGRDITSTDTIHPGIHHDVALTGGDDLTFVGPGRYIFNSIANTNGRTGTANTFTFDFQNNQTGVFELYINGNVDLQKLKVNVINNNNSNGADRIYTEVHGNGNANGYSFVLAADPGTAPTGPPSPSTWAGTVWAVNSGISIGGTGPGSTTIAIVNGALWSSKNVRIDGFSVINYVPLILSANPVPNVDILPYYPPPDGGKVNQVIGSELQSLFENFNPSTSNGSNHDVNFIYRINGNKVKIEVIALQGKYPDVLAFLISKGLTGIVNNGPGSLIITGDFPIANLAFLNTRADIIDYCRPLFLPLNNSGVTLSQGDSAMRSNFVKNNFNISGNGVKVGVISNSYNTIPGNYAGIDIANGDLPGAGNPNGDVTPVDLVMEYPYGQQTDEGRAMLQIVHDVAPKALLAFRSGFVSAGDFAQGIQELTTAGCKVIVDDVTYITEPFYKDGVVAMAVDQAVASGTTYFSAAGNFGRKSYESAFNGIAVPNGLGITGTVHNFGGATGALQRINFLEPGNYTIVLQWDDDIYSFGSPTAGTQTDLDIYLVDNGGTTLFGFNRNNIGNDPLEVLPFTVTVPTTGYLMIAKASGPDVHFKYIVFRGNIALPDFPQGASTLVGQANAAGANAVGAVFFGFTPPFGVTPPTIASFSSNGGMPVNGVDRHKPEFTAPNGVNTTVFLGSNYPDGDNFPNFFGTSAAAPHAAAAAALLIEAKQKFQGQVITPAGIRTLLQNTAIDMGVAGYDPESGKGFIQPFAAIQTFASPRPNITSVIIPGGVTPGIQTFVVTVIGDYLNPQTKIYFGGSQLATTFDILHPNQVTATIPLFLNNPPLQLYNPPITSSSLDGGLSDPRFLKHKKHIVVTADNKSKKYGENLPLFTSSITVDDVALSASGLTAHDLKLDNLQYQTPATSSSNVASYFIHPVNPLNPADPIDAALLDLYSYDFIDGLLDVQKMPLHIMPRDTSIVIGKPIRGINFNYVLGPSPNIQNPDSLINTIDLSHKALIVDSVIAILNAMSTDSRALVNTDFDNMSILVSGGTTTDSRALVNTDPPGYAIDVAAQSVINYQADPANGVLINGSTTTDSRALVNNGAVVNGSATTDSRALVNGDPTVLNGNTTSPTSNANTAIIVSSTDVPDLTNNQIDIRAVNMVTGITPGVHTIIPAAFLSENFDITYGTGTLTILPSGQNFYVSTTGDDHNDGSLLHPFRTMQHANDTSIVHSTDIINVLAGAYTESVHISKSLKFYGPNYNVSPNGGARNPEAVITPLFLPQPVSISAFLVHTEGTDIEIKGFKFLNGAPLTDAHVPRTATGSNDITIVFEKNWVQHGNNLFAGTLTRWKTVTVTDNFFDGIDYTTSSSAIQFNDAGVHAATVNATITDNVITGATWAGILLDNIASATVLRNKITNVSGEAGIQLAGGMGNALINQNEITNANASSAVGAEDGGIKIYGSGFTGTVNVTNNKISNALNGFVVKNGEDITGKAIHVNNNSFAPTTKFTIYHGGTGPLDAMCNWHGIATCAGVTAKISAPGLVTFANFLNSGTDNDLVATGFQPVPGSCVANCIAAPIAAPATEFSVYPVPASDFININFTNANEAKVNIVIVDGTGRILQKENKILTEGESTIRVNIQKLLKGVYTLIFNDGTKQWHQKIIKL